ncbi:MAG TPA: protein kinase [Candidatus Binatia bacterium]|nr:protein kinase [Candidatus Binatia bacterium]
MGLAPGARYGTYEIVAPLGAGGMGEVWRARDLRLGRDVAIKALPQPFATDPTRLARFEQEARSLAALSHPNIAAIYGLIETDGAPLLLLELVEGETLASRLERGPLPPAETGRLGLQLAAAIEVAHGRGIVHRDLKPRNLMLTPSGSIKVLDFGLAKAERSEVATDRSATLVDSMTSDGTVLGTAPYMSPEQVRGLPVDRRTDIWSFGCVLFECLTGSPPFQGATVSDLIAGILEREPEWQRVPPGTPGALRELVRRCVRKRMQDRPQEIREVRLELEVLAAGRAAPGVRGGAEEEKSIAVLPFEHASGAEDEYFADGIAEEILNALAKLKGLRVAARTSSFAFKGRQEDLRTVAERLSVATVLEGSVRRAGNRLRVTARLVSAGDGYQLWSERYDRELNDVFEVQDEIANAIAGKLQVTFAGGSDRLATRRGTSNPEAYDCFLKGKAVQIQRRSIDDAIRWFERALELDPSYADALAWMSDSYRLLGTYGVAPCSAVMPRARDAASRALALEPDLAEAHAVLADIEMQYERDEARATLTWNRALAIEPRHVQARCERALWLLGFGAWDAARSIAEAGQVLEYDPLNAWAWGMMSFLCALGGRLEESLEAALRGVAIDPASYFAQLSVLRCYAWSGDHARAIEYAPRVLAMSGRHPWALGTLAGAYAASGRAHVARAIYDELEARSRMEFTSPMWIATAAGFAGLDDVAMDLAERAVDQREPLTLLARLLPDWAPLRSHLRFPALVQKMGLRSPP